MQEQECLERLRGSFLSSQKLREQVRYMLGNGSMYLQRGDCLIFRGCVPVDADGKFLELEIDGRHFSGKALNRLIEAYRSNRLHEQ